MPSSALGGLPCCCWQLGHLHDSLLACARFPGIDIARPRGFPGGEARGAVGDCTRRATPNTDGRLLLALTGCHASRSQLSLEESSPPPTALLRPETVASASDITLVNARGRQRSPGQLPPLAHSVQPGARTTDSHDSAQVLSSKRASGAWGLRKLARRREAGNPHCPDVLAWSRRDG
ncbi:hypothetical protein K491DRAFT_121832 [Lophiostoma macrostomum CBS 122681]|uniref:Uncharacterized protein n=1 Tax=Lophiostoma macrostomum CBS 122681 TaxID=1314788 RepID=A0A6A6TMV3_9PLEO|nr:hypothetical protein K491DRAFT_121832 [Lophiostoma macrostomum CBS 122681]